MRRGGRRLRLLRLFNWSPPTYKARKECGEQKKSEANSDATPTLVDPSEVTLLGRVSADKLSSGESTPKQKKKRSNGSPKSSRRRHSSKPTSDDLKSLDDKWSERFSRLEAMLLSQSFAVPVSRVLLLVLCLLRILVPVLLRLPVCLHS